MGAKQYPRGHECYYDYEKKQWFYYDDDTPVTFDRCCKRCGKNPVDDKDYCLRDLENQIEFACCGHGVEKGYI